MGTTGVVLAGAVGALVGALAPLAASRIAEPRYAEGTEGHDADDEALAPVKDLAAPNVRIASGVVGALACVLLANQWGVWQFAVVFCALALVLLPACLVDLRYLRLPNVFTYGGAVIALGLIIVMTIDIGFDRGGGSVRRQLLEGALVGGVLYAGFLFVVAEAFRLLRGVTGMGLGDVKLALSLGLTLGWGGWAVETSLLGTFRYVIYAALAGNVLGAVGGLVMTRLRPNRSFPFGPFLALGWLIVLALQP